MICPVSHAKPGAMVTVEGLQSGTVCLSNRSLTKPQTPETLTGLCQNIHSFCSTIPNSLAFTIMKQLGFYRNETARRFTRSIFLPLLYNKSSYSNIISKFAISHFKRTSVYFSRRENCNSFPWASIIATVYPQSTGSFSSFPPPPMLLRTIAGKDTDVSPRTTLETTTEIKKTKNMPYSERP